MARRFLSARGDAAKYLGPSVLDGDLVARRMDSLGEARRALGTFRGVLDGFAQGYNLYVQQHRDSLPSWVLEVTSADVNPPRYPSRGQTCRISRAHAPCSRPGTRVRRRQAAAPCCSSASGTPIARR